MFAALIRRRSAQPAEATGDTAFESTTFTLTTAVPRPTERRGQERVAAMLRVAKLTNAAGQEQLIKVKNLSAGGLMAIASHAPGPAEQVFVELSSQKIPSTVVWTRGDLIGLKFDQNVDL